MDLGLIFNSLQHSAGPLAVGGEAESRGCWCRGGCGGGDEDDEEDESGCGWLALAGWLTRWLGGRWLAAWLARWLGGWQLLLAGWLARWLAVLADEADEEDDG